MNLRTLLLLLALAFAASTGLAQRPSSGNDAAPASGSVETPSGKPSSPSAPKGLQWRKLDAQGRDAGLVARLQPREKPIIGYMGKRQPDGSFADIKPMRALDPKGFLGSEVYFAELDAKVRRAPAYIIFLLRGTMRAEPEQGTILNIDGAVMGFREQKKPARAADQTPNLAELVTLDVDESGAQVWRGTGFHYSLHAEDPLSGGTKMCVRLDHAEKTWTLYFRDLIVAEGLPLFALSERPTVTIRAGLVPEDEAWVNDLRVVAKLPGRGPFGLPAENGRLDLKGARERGDPRLDRSERFGARAAAGLRSTGARP
ncbi:MAG: hypothetical protein ACREIA_01145 [Opitutaceae bacterium]